MDETVSPTLAVHGPSHSSQRCRCSLKAPVLSRVSHINHHRPWKWTKQSNQHLRRTGSKSVSRFLYLFEKNNLLILQPKHGVKGNRACLMLSNVEGMTLSSGLWLGNHLSQRLCQTVHSDYVNKLWKSLPIMLTWTLLNIDQPLSDEFYPTNIPLDGDC